MEIYRGTTNRVFFTAPDNTSVVTVAASLNGGPFQQLGPAGGNGGNTRARYFDIPFIQNEGTLEVEWSWNGLEFGPAGVVNSVSTQRTNYDIVTPILTESEILTIHPQATSGEIGRIEKAVRHVINAHCGQNFGKFVGEYSVQGNGGSLLQLPSRLLSLVHVDRKPVEGKFTVENGGWAIRSHPWGVPPVKADAYGLHMHTGGVIHNPNSVKLGTFDTGRTYSITGSWGWEYVPPQVEEAAKLLVNDYACADAQYRDRYLTSMTAADWRIQFNAGAFTQTGNVRADQLLSDFVMQRGWAVL